MYFRGRLRSGDDPASMVNAGEMVFHFGEYVQKAMTALRLVNQTRPFPS